jgi:hypothetical protein
VAVLGVPAGVYNVVDDEPLTHRALGEVPSRSLRLSNGKLRAACAWAPVYHVALALFRALASASLGWLGV